MQKKITMSLFLAVFALFAFSCTTTMDKSQIKGDDFVTEGWLDENTFQVKTLGAPNPDAKGFVRRRTQAKESALIMAQKRVVELLVGSIISGASGVDSGESTGVAVTKEFEGTIKGGSIVKETYDGDDNCEMTYRIHAKGLKKQAEALAKKSDFRQ